MYVIGDRDHPRPDGIRIELRASRAGTPILIAYGETLTKFTSHDKAGSVPYCECKIESKNLQAIHSLSQGDDIEYWVERPNESPVRLIRARIDFVEVDADPPQQVGTVYFEGRTEVSNLMDAALKLEHEGSLEVLFLRTAASHRVIARCDFPRKSVRVWIDAASAYGGLVLVGASTGVMVQADRDGGLTFISYLRALELLKGKPVPTIRMDDAIHVHHTQGTRLRKPTDESK